MTTEDSYAVITTLLDRVGTDPAISLQGMSVESVRGGLQHALHLIQSRLDSETRREETPPKAGEPWEDSEDETLLMQHKARMPLLDMAAYHKRSEGAIQRRIEKLYAMKAFIDAL